jgi:integrase/recombinase XerD
MTHSDSSEPWVERGKAHLVAHGYAVETFKHFRATTRRFLAFLRRQHVDISSAQCSHVSSYLEAERRRFRRRHGRDPNAGGWSTRHTAPIHLLFRLARGSWPPPALPPATSHERFRRELRDGFRHWMMEVRGLSVLTFTKDWYTADRFLEWLGARASPASLRRLTPVDLDGFLAWRAPGIRRATRVGVCQGLRSFLRYLHGAGLIGRDLSACVTRPPLYWNEGIPSAYTDAQVKAMLVAARRDRSDIGRRDYAILLLLATYGLRAGEITRLRLDDIDWRRGRFSITQSKSHRSSQLPLLAPVGTAILDYLEHVRPRSEHRQVFLFTRAPYRPFACGSSLGATVGRCLLRAGITPAGKHGCHAFRYARAVSLLRAAVPLKAISDILGHRSPSSTDIYLKLATEDLRDVGLEVPPEVTP